MSKGTSLTEVDNKGTFIRTASVFRDKISSEVGAQYPPEAGRYHLYVSYACPWANRTIIFRLMKGLEDAISISVVLPIWGEVATGRRGWVFPEKDEQDATIDHNYKLKSLLDIYRTHDPSWEGKVTVPILWDKKTKKIVNNESSEIIRMLNFEFNTFAKYPDLDLYPLPLRNKIDELNDYMYNRINNGVYRCGFATTQGAYEQAFVELFEGIEFFEKHLSTTRFLVGDEITEADIRLFVTIIRFDAVYFGHFKCNKKRIIDCPNLQGWMKDLYQHPRIGKTIFLNHIKNHYYGSHVTINPYSIVPVGPDLDFNTPHGRGKKLT